MLIAIHGVKLYGQCYTRSEAICSLLYMEVSFMLIAIIGVKLYAYYYIWIEALCSLLLME